MKLGQLLRCSMACLGVMLFAWDHVQQARQLRRMERERQAQARQVRWLEGKRDQLRFNIHALKHCPTFVESVARELLGWRRPKEFRPTRKPRGQGETTGPFSPRRPRLAGR